MCACASRCSCKRAWRYDCRLPRAPLRGFALGGPCPLAEPQTVSPGGGEGSFVEVVLSMWGQG
eukprot:7681988-Alexandrium_andersonii.AAC.1